MQQQPDEHHPSAAGQLHEGDGTVAARHDIRRPFQIDGYYGVIYALPQRVQRFFEGVVTVHQQNLQVHNCTLSQRSALGSIRCVGLIMYQQRRLGLQEHYRLISEALASLQWARFMLQA